MGGIAHDAVPGGSEAHGVAEGEPQHRGPDQRDEALGHDGEHVPPPHEAALEEGQARGHEHDQAGAKQHECCVSYVDWHGRHKATSESGFAGWPKYAEREL